MADLNDLEEKRPVMEFIRTLAAPIAALASLATLALTIWRMT